MEAITAAHNVFDSFIKQYPNSELLVDGMLEWLMRFYSKEYEKAINGYLDIVKKDSGESVKITHSIVLAIVTSPGHLEKATMAYNTVLSKGAGGIQDAMQPSEF